MKNDFQDVNQDTQIFFAELFDALEKNDYEKIKNFFFNSYPSANPLFKTKEFQDFFSELFQILKAISSDDEILIFLKSIYVTEDISPVFQNAIGDIIINDFFKDELKSRTPYEATQLLTTIAEPLRENGNENSQSYQTSINIFIDYIGSFTPKTSLDILHLFNSDHFFYDGSSDGAGGTYYTQIRKDILAGVNEKLPEVVALREKIKNEEHEKKIEEEERHWESLSFKEKLYKNYKRAFSFPRGHPDMEQVALVNKNLQTLQLSTNDRMLTYLFLLKVTRTRLEAKKNEYKISDKSEEPDQVSNYRQQVSSVLDNIKPLISQVSDDYIIDTSLDLDIFTFDGHIFMGYGCKELSDLIISEKGPKIIENGFPSIVFKSPRSVRACFTPTIFEEYFKQNSLLDTVKYLNIHAEEHDFDLVKEKAECAPLILKILDQCEEHISEKAVLDFSQKYSIRNKKAQHLYEKCCAKHNESLLQGMPKTLEDAKKRLKDFVP